MLGLQLAHCWAWPALTAVLSYQGTVLPMFGTFTLDHKGNAVFQMNLEFCKRASCRDALRPDAPGTLPPRLAACLSLLPVACLGSL